jgi:hypothetical protein
MTGLHLELAQRNEALEKQAAAADRKLTQVASKAGASERELRKQLAAAEAQAAALADRFRAAVAELHAEVRGMIAQLQPGYVGCTVMINCLAEFLSQRRVCHDMTDSVRADSAAVKLHHTILLLVQAIFLVLHAPFHSSCGLHRLIVSSVRGSLFSQTFPACS